MRSLLAGPPATVTDILLNRVDLRNANMIPTSTFPIFILALLPAPGLAGGEPGEEDPGRLASELPPLKPLSPEEALRSFRIVPGFAIELVAAEPLVIDPVAMAFDEDGRMWVVEMRDYPFSSDRDKIGRASCRERV